MELSNELGVNLEEYKGRERIPWVSLSNILAGVGNSEAKALCLLIMEPDCIYSGDDIATKLRELQIPGRGWPDYAGSNVTQYLDKTFKPIGLVAESIDGHWDSRIGFQKTLRGAGIGDAVAGLMLEFSENHSEYGLRQIIGKTASSASTKITDVAGEEIEHKKRPIDTLIQLYWELLTTSQDTLTVNQLANVLGERGGDILAHVKNLSDCGIIDYETRGRSDPWQTHQYTGESKLLGKERPAEESTGRLGSVYNFFKTHPEGHYTVEEVFEAMKLEYPDDDPKKLLIDIYEYVDRLRTRGYLQNTSKFTKKYGSKIALKPEAYDSVHDLVSLVDKIQNVDTETLAHGKRVGREILADRERVTVLMEKARSTSPDANRKPISEMTEVVLDILSANPGVTRNVVRQLLSERGYRYTPKNVGNILDKLHLRGVITKETTSSRINKWFVSPGGESSGVNT
ncbi:hypothetical protein A3C23_01955 [Candidatus Roizmanbacteria bacterium RIFCSPHIGHO2_02_FULL_37_13b]|uniref:Uncharacterized protein n=1 Tax=Candidatus Roizmanbacteria bacterium RIFCSPLOWO2_02_FULL_36_11 TaxID=1802071 RepID=A0A1F7JBN3_9BACT|nr:MAG: hypothetical protein A3C23_01955 [Candidatus Roizmanbacteria bacterium RIFCSPHIGHO2_02_FULL_37_13b]OGK53016.1 MAG: hypothetical protein A3H78_02275 [Candidatus Roizmanbacteria bacterium RIFCSPLOWO2_02_FULL_36_11]